MHPVEKSNLADMESEIHMLENTVRWMFFNVILALMPLIFSYILIKIARINTSWVELLKDGELFFFSTALSASSIGTLFFAQKPQTILFGLITAYLILIVFVISTGLFSLATYQKLKREEFLDKKIFSNSSVWCAAIAILLSYFAFIQSGSK